ncbi:MAG: sulfatase [Rhodothermales bacterium]
MPRDRRPIARLFILFCWAALSLFLAGCAQTPRPPNVVFILIDDLGWMDLGVQGSSFYETPHIDRLARQGALFTQAYAASGVCSPTRASIQTGRYPARLHITDWIPGEGDVPGRTFMQVQDRDELPLGERTLAEAFRDAGYATAHIGKWHLGGKGHLPTDQGYDVNIAGNDRGQPPTYFYPYERGDYVLDDLRLGGHEGEYLPDRLAQEAVGYIEQHAEQPFFLHLAFYEVHTPLEGKPELIEKYKGRQPAITDDERFSPLEGRRRLREVQDHPTYAAMVESMDTAVGVVLDALDRNGLTDDTIVVFTSDNGGLATVVNPPTSNKPLRWGKGWLYEGGIRVPLLVRWPGQVTPARLATPAMSTDFYPTLLDMAGIRENRAVDGVSLWPALQGGDLPERPLFWYYPHYHTSGSRPTAAVRQGPYKLFAYLEDGRRELYNLDLDIGESTDLAAVQPERVAAMDRMLQDWLAGVGAQPPQAMPDSLASQDGP